MASSQRIAFLFQCEKDCPELYLPRGPIKLTLDCRTRFGSTYLMIRRYERLAPAIRQFVNTYKCQHDTPRRLKLSTIEWSHSII
jgi:hypothetical protein